MRTSYFCCDHYKCRPLAVYEAILLQLFYKLQMLTGQKMDCTSNSTVCFSVFYSAKSPEGGNILGVNDMVSI